MYPAVDVQGLAADPPRIRRGQVGAREADVHDVDELAEGRAFRRLGEQQVEVLETGGGPCLERPRGRSRGRGCPEGPARRRGSGKTPPARPSPGPSRCSWEPPCWLRDSSLRTWCRPPPSAARPAAPCG